MKVPNGMLPNFIKSVQDTRQDDLRETVLAENVQVQTHRVPNYVSITFDFLCPHCGKRHWAEEIDGSHLFSIVGWRLRCGLVTVRMPWAQTPVRDNKSVFGCIDWSGERPKR